MAKSNLKLNVLLKHLDLRNPEIFAALSQTEADRKELERALAYLLPLWVSGTIEGRDQIALMFTFNQHVNIGWSELDQHPELRAKVLASVGLGRVVRHDYQARERRKATTLLDFLSRRYPDIREPEVELWCATNSEADLIALCRDYGMQEDARRVIIDEYRNMVT